MRQRKASCSKPEFIFKETYAVSAVRRPEYPCPVLVLLANRAGWLQLAAACRRMAKRRGFPGDALDPDDHCHLYPALSDRLSDKVEIRAGILTPTNRKAVFKRYGISLRTRKRGSLIPRYKELIRSARAYLRSEGQRA